MTQYVQEKVERLESPVTSWVLLGIIASLLFAYAAFINATISNIVATKDIQSKVGELTASVSGLESTYLSLKSTITSTDALAMGFVQETGDTVFVSKAAAASLTFNR